MPRITLKQFQMPDYASQVPNVPRSERPVQKIADLLYVLHGVPWFKKKQERGESGVSDSESGVSADEANEAVTDALVKGDSLEDAALAKAREPDFGLDQAMPIELQLMGIRKPFAVVNATETNAGNEKKDDDAEDEKALNLWADAEMERYIDNAINRELWGD